MVIGIKAESLYKLRYQLHFSVNSTLSLVGLCPLGGAPSLAARPLSAAKSDRQEGMPLSLPLSSLQTETVELRMAPRG